MMRTILSNILLLSLLINVNNGQIVEQQPIEYTGIGSLDCSTISCVGQTIIIIDPLPGFIIICIRPGICSGLQIEIRITIITIRVIQYAGVLCEGEGACLGLKLTVYTIDVVIVQIQLINCIGSRACANAGFIGIGDVQFAPILCEGVDSCLNCIVPNQGIECDGTSIINPLPTPQPAPAPVPVIVTLTDTLHCGVGSGVTLCQAQNIIIHANNAFHLICDTPNSCQQLVLTIYVEASLTFFIGYYCNGQAACKNIQIIIINVSILYVENIECIGSESCLGAVFRNNPGVTYINPVNCVGDRACSDCILDGAPCQEVAIP